MSDTIQEIDIRSIVENPHQPRKIFSHEEIEELAASIQEIGLIHPPVVRKIGPEVFELVAGERRFRALKSLGKTKVIVLVKNLEEAKSAHSALIENIQRVDLNAIEVAYALKKLMDDFQLTQELVADKVGKKRSTVANFLRLLQLPVEIQNFVRIGKLTMGHAKAVLTLSPKKQMPFCMEIIEKGLSVRAAENKVKQKAVSKEKEDDVHRREIEKRLQHKWGTRIEITKNKILIDYYGLDDLDRWLEIFEV